MESGGPKVDNTSHMSWGCGFTKLLRTELDVISSIKESDCPCEKGENTSLSSLKEENLLSFGDALERSKNNRSLLCKISKVIEAKKIDVNVQESLSLETANSLLQTLTSQLSAFNSIACQTSSWEEMSAAVKLANKIRKSKRNKKWKKKKRKHVTEMLQKERAMYDQVDQAADEWRAREIAKDIAKRKLSFVVVGLGFDMGKVALYFQLELVLMVEKLQELRSIRIQKLKKQGHFLPEEDDKFLEIVRAAVEEEERQAAAAADTDAAKDAIATAEETRNTIEGAGADAKNLGCDITGFKPSQKWSTETKNQIASGTDANLDSTRQGLEVQSGGVGYESLANLPVEFYHYYHGSNTDMGTLIETLQLALKDIVVPCRLEECGTHTSDLEEG
ncbi:hypothetical protein ACLOJK_000698 [Asimina triloba]